MFQRNGLDGRGRKHPRGVRAVRVRNIRPNEGAGACTPCPNETTADGATILPESKPGSTKYSDCSTVSDDAEELCDAGEGREGEGAPCEPCAPGSVNPGTLSSCQECPAGTYADDGRSECHPCPPNTFWSGSGAPDADSCEPCPSGFYSDRTDGASECDACPAAHLASGAGAAGCAALPGSSAWLPLGAAQPIPASSLAVLVASGQRAALLAQHGAEGASELAKRLEELPESIFFTGADNSVTPSGTDASTAGASAAALQCFDGGRMCIGTEVPSTADASAEAASLLALVRVYFFSAAGVVVLCMLARFAAQSAPARLGWARFDKLFNSAHAVPSESMPAVAVQRRTGLGGLATLAYGAVAAAALAFLVAQFALANVVVTRAINVRSADLTYTSSMLRVDASLVGSGVECASTDVSWEQSGIEGVSGDGECATVDAGDGTPTCAVECVLVGAGDGWQLVAGEARLTLRFPARLAYALRWRLVVAAAGEGAQSALSATLVAAGDDEALQGEASWMLDALPSSIVDTTREPHDISTGYTLIFSGYETDNMLRRRERISSGASDGEPRTLSVSIVLKPIGLASTETRSNALTVTQFLPIAFSAMTGILALARFVFKKMDGAVSDDARLGRQPLRDVHAAVHATLEGAHAEQAVDDARAAGAAQRRRSTQSTLHGRDATETLWAKNDAWPQSGSGVDQEEGVWDASATAGDATCADADAVPVAMQEREHAYSANPLYNA